MKKQEVYFAGGCFWGTEHFMKMIAGVQETQVGYANSLVEHPSYQEVKTSRTGAVETVKVIYDAEAVSLKLLIQLFFKMIDPTSLNQQGEDIGTQYRTGIYFTDETLLPLIEATIKELASGYDKPLAVEVLPLKNFFSAEEYHQDYLDKNPGGYCHVSPELFELARKANR